jgi:sec-independent protein translocase protein TatA
VYIIKIFIFVKDRNSILIMFDLILFISGSEIFVILLVVLLLFGANKIPEIARGLGKGFREFKRATQDIRSEFDEQTRDIKNEVNNIKNNLNNDLNFEDIDEKDESSTKNNNTSQDNRDDPVDDVYKNNPNDSK